MPLCLHVQWECTLIVQSWALLFFCSFRIEYVLFAQLELLQCGGDGEAILFHWGLSHNKVITAGEVYFISDLTDDVLHSTMLCHTFSAFWDAFSFLSIRLRGEIQTLFYFMDLCQFIAIWLSGPVWYLKRQYQCYYSINNYSLLSPLLAMKYWKTQNNRGSAHLTLSAGKVQTQEPLNWLDLNHAFVDSRQLLAIVIVTIIVWAFF